MKVTDEDLKEGCNCKDKDACECDYKGRAEQLENYLEELRKGLADEYNALVDSISKELNIANRYELRIKAETVLAIYNKFFGTK